jgi:hypothetical protein
MLLLLAVGYFIETGANVGSTLAYVARTYPHVRCMSCGPGVQAYLMAVKNSNMPNVMLYNESSQAFLARLQAQYSHLFDCNILFWLDAHGY